MVAMGADSDGFLATAHPINEERFSRLLRKHDIHISDTDTDFGVPGDICNVAQDLRAIIPSRDVRLGRWDPNHTPVQPHVSS